MNNPPSGSSSEAGTVRALVATDAARGYALSTEAGWNQNEADWHLLLQMCRGYGIEVPGRGLVGTTMAWELERKYAWVNMVLVTPACRGQGLARKLMEKCLQDAAAGERAVLLDATDLGAKLYTKLGFAGTERIVRLRLEERRTLPEASADSHSLAAGEVKLAAALDRAVVGFDRTQMLLNFYQRLPGAAWRLKHAHGGLQALAMGRNGRTAAQLGPVIANSPGEARELLLRALRHTKGPLIMDVPAVHAAWVSELKQLGFVPQRSFIRMGLNAAKFPTDWSRYYAIAGPDFA
ncbi:MAG: GNAT family N-acetyltransferase [Cephaloticoccus sp.]|nr:GNAT family N-acetyltransferase [Cephaloticoccus sp.]MCF7759573.1 GNAT family N-acetyltransferase [Cephaloticoccus sp.]